MAEVVASGTAFAEDIELNARRRSEAGFAVPGCARRLWAGSHHDR